MKKIYLLIMALCCVCTVFCQDITGLWKGIMYNDSTHQQFDYEMVIRRENGKLSGYSHTWFLINEKKYYGVKKLKVKIARDGKIIVEDAELIANNYPVSINKYVRQLNVLDMLTREGQIILDGAFVTNRTKEFMELTGHINVKRENELSKSDLLDFLQKSSLDNILTIAK